MHVKKEAINTQVTHGLRWQKLRDQWSPKGQGLLPKNGPPMYAILSRNLVLSQFTCFLKGFHAIIKNNVYVAKMCKFALYESSEGFCRKLANPCHSAWPLYLFKFLSLPNVFHNSNLSPPMKGMSSSFCHPKEPFLPWDCQGVF